MSAEEVTTTRAKNMGWVDKDQFRGDPEKWIDAETFVERGENTLPILRERLGNLEGKLTNSDRMLSEATRKIDEQTQTMREFAEYNRKNYQRAYAQAEKDIKSKMRLAVREGDEQAFSEAEHELDALQKDKPEPPAAPAASKGNGQPQLSPEDDAAVKQFQEKNKLVFQNPRLYQEVEQLNSHFLTQNPGASVSAQLAYLDQEIERRYGTTPKSSNGKPSKTTGAASVETDALPFVERSRGADERTYANLPPEAKAACDKFVKDKLLTREQYVQEYAWDQSIERPRGR